jgi:hypothetical protein
MTIRETKIFTRQILDVMEDEEYRHLQNYLIARPDAGAVIPHSKGLRKLRWSLETKGKRGGLRIIYY